MAELIVIKVIIGDRSFRLKTNRSDEEVVRKTVQMVNHKVMEYKTKFAGKDMQDYISMALLWFATEQNKAGSFMLAQLETQQKISNLESKLDKMLNDEDPLF